MMVYRLSNTALWREGEALLEYIASFDEQSVIYTLVFLVAVTVCVLLNRPINYIRDMSDVGYGYLTDNIPRWRRAQRVKEINDQRLYGDIPPVYPNGWFILVESRDLKEGQTKAVTALGHEFAVFRGENKKAYVMDAFCPHLGAHLAVGGKISGSCIECPFHGWRFRGEDGKCVHVPNSDKVPETATVKTWTSCEVNGCIFVWHHAEGEPPQWQVPEVPEIASGQWTYKGRTQHTICCHIQELPENGPDIAHLNQIHTAAVVTGGDLRYNDSKIWQVVKHIWKPNWEVMPAPDEHIAKLTVNQKISIFGITCPLFEFQVTVKQIGPALVIFWVESFVGKGVLIHFALPEGPLRQKLVQIFYAESKFINLFARLFLRGEATMVERDIMVWNNKIFLKKPHLIKEDRLIAQFRRWYSQFYSPNSPTLKSIREKSLEW